MSPFDIAKALTQTKIDVWISDTESARHYEPFMINRILSNSDRTVFFAEVMNKYPDVDKKLQYDFYLHGIPRSRGYEKMWTKKDPLIHNAEHINYIARQLNCSIKRAIELYPLIGSEVCDAEAAKHGGKETQCKPKKSNTRTSES